MGREEHGRDLAHGRSSTGYAKEEGGSHLEDQLDHLLDRPSFNSIELRSQTSTLGKGWLGIEKPNIKRSLDTRSFKSRSIKCSFPVAKPCLEP
ncbi:unnamed protein product [Microthlaspi erraticum]|uniref:Uncharacterized protein n=1 Tax=Microthlaspi erraticum TaxID=1685480 RepID=A0A6D2KIM1_9BRAS|nr:unnamed protein product [Microthlaspi erraticum]